MEVDKVGLRLFATEVKKEPGVRKVYFFGSNQTGFSQRKNRPPNDDSDTDIGVIHEPNKRLPQEKITEIIGRLGLEGQKIQVTQRSTMAASGDDYLNGLFSQDTVVYEIMAGEEL